jgi:hypothetical protein
MGAGRKAFCIRVIVLYIGKLLHPFGVPTVLFYSRENELLARCNRDRGPAVPTSIGGLCGLAQH